MPAGGHAGHPAVDTFHVEDAMTSQTGLRSDESSRLADAARNVADQAGHTVEAQASTAMDQIATTVEQVAQAVRRAGEELRHDQPQIASIADSAASQVDRLADYLEGHEPREMFDSIQDGARRQPAVVIGAGIAIGLVLGRLLRTTMPTNGSGSGSSRYRGGTSSRYGYTGSGYTGSAMSGGTNGGGRFSDTGDSGSSIVASTRAVPAGGTIETGSTSRPTSTSGATSTGSTATRSSRSSRSTGSANG
jgi:hypothetical protein